MNPIATAQLHEVGQSLWLDNITRDLLTSGTLERYIDELSITGLTSNPTIFDHAITKSHAYDAAIRQKMHAGKSGEDLFFDLAIEDLTQAADLFGPIYDETDGVDGWVSLEVSPLLAYDTARTIVQAKELHARARRPNLLLRSQGRRKDCPRSRKRFLRGFPSTSRCSSHPSITWPPPTPICAASSVALPPASILTCARWRRSSSAAGTKRSWTRSLRSSGTNWALPWRSARIGPTAACSIPIAFSGWPMPGPERSGFCGPAPVRRIQRPPISCCMSLAAPHTVNTMPEATLQAFANHREIGPLLTADDNAEEILARFERTGIDVEALDAELQREGAKSFVDSWKALMAGLATKSETLKKAG